MAKTNQVSIPYLDPRIQHVWISLLRLLKYEHFLVMQEKILKSEG